LIAAGGAVAAIPGEDDFALAGGGAGFAVNDLVVAEDFEALDGGEGGGIKDDLIAGGGGADGDGNIDGLRIGGAGDHAQAVEGDLGVAHKLGGEGELIALIVALGGEAVDLVAAGVGTDDQVGGGAGGGDGEGKVGGVGGGGGGEGDEGEVGADVGAGEAFAAVGVVPSLVEEGVGEVGGAGEGGGGEEEGGEEAEGGGEGFDVHGRGGVGWLFWGWGWGRMPQRWSCWMMRGVGWA